RSATPGCGPSRSTGRSPGSPTPAHGASNPPPAAGPPSPGPAPPATPAARAQPPAPAPPHPGSPPTGAAQHAPRPARRLPPDVRRPSPRPYRTPPRRSVGLHTPPRVGYRQRVSGIRHRVTTDSDARRRPTTERPPTAGESADRGPNHRRRDLPWLTEAYPPTTPTPAPAPAPA